MTGKVYLIGAGPGRPDLVTVRGLKILRQADVVIHDYLVDRGILDEAREGAEFICTDGLGKKRYEGDPSGAQERINGLMVEEARKGRRVVRLKNGDPAIFGRCSQELEALAKGGITFETVPGITAASAASSLSGIPLTDRRFVSGCVFVTGHEDISKNGSVVDWNSMAKSGTVVLYMAVRNLENIVNRILGAGRDENTPVAIVQDVSLPTQKVLTGTLRDISSEARRRGVGPPAVIIIGEVAGLEKDFDWLKKSRRVLFTGLSEERFFTEGTYFHLPMIRIKPMESYDEFDGYVRRIRDFDWIVFTSRYGVEHFFRRLRAAGRDSRALCGVKAAAVGGSTKERLRESGVDADLVPEKESSAGLLEEFAKMDISGMRIFMPRSDISDKGLAGGLEALGAEVATGFAYRNVMPGGLPDLDLEFFDEIVFTSPSTVRNFKIRYKSVPQKVTVTCIGDVTRREAKRCGLSG